MTVESAPFFWLRCDAPDCDVRCPDVADEYSAWADEETALMMAQESEWLATDDGRHYCENHAMNVCERCGKYDPTPLAGEREYLCVAHFKELEESEA